MLRIRVSGWRKWWVVSAICLVGLPGAYSQTAVRNRILQSVDNSRMAVLQGTAHPLARSKYDRGMVEPDMPIPGVSLAFSLSPSQQADARNLLAALHDPSSALYHRWLTPEQYAARFGMSDDDLNLAETWLQSQGFTGLTVSRSCNSISFSGTAAQIGAAFQTEIHHYEVNGETHFANSSALSMPSALAGVVLGVRNLNDFRPKPRSHRMSAHFTSTQTGNHYLTPGDFATIYDIAPLYTAGLDGSGVTIAVAGQTLIDITDANAFRSAAHLSANPPQLLLVPNTGSSETFTGDIDEANLDVEWSGGVAKNATVVFAYAGNNQNSGVFDALQYIIDQDLAPVISISYGLCEADFGTSQAQTVQSWVQQANMQGQTLTAASGDAGAADCDGDASTTPSVATRGLSVDVPAAIPEVTAVGGTEFCIGQPGQCDLTDPATYWTPANGSDVISSALSYIPEMAWNDSPTTGTGPTLAPSLSAGGGGVSTIFTTKPAWQAALTPNDAARDVPDIALAGSPDHDGYLVCSQGSCFNGFRFSNGDLNAFGGTSVGSQVMGGILAIVNQATNTATQTPPGLGNANIELYKLAGTTPAAFHDTTAGNILVPCTPGTPSSGPVSLRCPTSGTAQIGYSAKAGYDLATGLGSLDVNLLAHAWTGFSATPSFTVSGNPITIGSAGSSMGSTITVSSTTGFGGASGATINLSCAFVPPQPASAGLSCSFGNTTPVTLSNTTTSATATLTVGTTAAHAISNPSAANRSRSLWFTLSGGFLACVFVAGIPAQRKRWLVLLGLISCAILAFTLGCGGGSSSGGGGGGTQTTATPTISPASGDYTGHVTVTFADASSGASLFCTADGSTPTTASPACATVDLTATTTIKAIAAASGMNNSTVASSTYTIQSGTAAGSYVVRVSATSGATVHTTDVTVTVQ